MADVVQNVKIKMGVDGAANAQAALNATNAAMDRLAGGGTKRLGIAMATTNNAAMNLGRVFQDMPFGMMGVANNIEPLLFSMRKLREEAAATNTSFAQMALGLFKGPAALTLGFSLLSAAMIGVPMLLRNIGSEADTTADKMQSLSDRLIKLGLGVPSIELAKERKNLSNIEAELQRARLGTGRAKSLIGTIAVPFDLPGFPKVNQAEAPDQSLILQLEERRVSILERIKSLEMAIEQSTARQAQNKSAINLGVPVEVPEIQAFSPISRGGLSIARRGAFPGAGGGRGLPPGAIGAQESIIADARQTQSQLNPIWIGIGGAISAHIGGAFRRVFGEANNLAADLFSSILGALVTFGVSAGLGALTGGAGIGLTGGIAGGLTGAPVSPGRVASATQRGRRRQSAPVQLYGTISGSDIAISNQRTTMLRRRYTV